MYDCEPGVLAILCRHGSTKANDESVPLVRGWSDVLLDDKGKIEVQLLGNKLKKYGAKKIYKSDFMRDSATAFILAEVLNISNVETDYDLRTWDVGSYSGKPLALVNHAIEELYKHPWEKPAGSDETFNDFSARFTSSLDKKLRLATINEFRPIIIVSHGKNLALAKTYIDGGNAWESIMPLPAGYATINVELDKSLSIDMVTPTEPVIEDE